MRTTLVKADLPIRNCTPRCTGVGKGLTFREKVGVNDKLVEVVIAEEREKSDGRREGNGRES